MNCKYILEYIIGILEYIVGFQMASKRRRVEKISSNSMSEKVEVENVELKKEIKLLNADVTLLIDELHKCCATLRRQDLVICSQLELIRCLSKFGQRNPPKDVLERSASLDNIMKKYVDKNLSTMLH